jgi:hypothetical protein
VAIDPSRAGSSTPSGVVREAHVALDSRADRAARAGGVADPVLASIWTDDDVLPLIAQVEIEEMLEPHQAPGTLLPGDATRPVGVAGREANSS